MMTLNNVVFVSHIFKTKPIAKKLCLIIARIIANSVANNSAIQSFELKHDLILVKLFIAFH